MKNLEFSDKNADYLYNNYIGDVKRIISVLPKEEQEELLMEINSHIYESIQKNTSSSEVVSITETLKKLGNPHDSFSPIVADRKLSQATKTFNPLHIIDALSLNLSNGFIYALFSGLYILLFAFIFLIFAKLIYPSNTGLFIGENKIHFGFISNISGESTTEVLGYWFIPFILMVMTLTYIFITLLLKLKHASNHRN